jgi:hypothetical protein
VALAAGFCISGLSDRPPAPVRRFDLDIDERLSLSAAAQTRALFTTST